MRDAAQATRVLLTNDDGHAAEGLQALRAALLDDGCSVVVLAPSGNRSGMGRAVTCHASVTVERVGGDDASPVYACSGSPVDCVRIGLFAPQFSPTDIVVSGINHGVNLGDDATYSGTLGAALEGALLGYPAVAFSQQDLARDLNMLSGARHAFDLTWVAAAIVREIAAHPPSGRTAANVNLPNRLRDPSIAVTRLGELTYDGRWMRPDQTTATGWTFWPYMRRDDPHPAIEPAADADTAAVTDGRVSLTPLSLDWRGCGQDVEWAGAIADAVADGVRPRNAADDRKVAGG
jgi:5'-nucleotidase